MKKMGHDAVIKNAFGFLENYDFIFTKDPMNPSRPCYKNWYGEIVIGLVHNSGWGGKDAEIFVQINGWKTTIDIDEEYKKYFGIKGFFIPWTKKFQTLFEYHAERTGNFYGLKIIKDNTYRQSHIQLEAAADDFTMDINPIKSRKSKNVVMLIIIFAIAFSVLAALAVILLDDIKSVTIYNTVLTIIFSILFLICAFFAVLLIVSKSISIVSAIIMTVYPLLLIYFIYDNPLKTDLQINTLVFFVLVIYSVFYIIKYFIIKYFITKNKLCFANIAAVLIIPLISLFIHSMESRHNVFVFNDEYMKILLIPAGIITLISVIIYIIFYKDRSSKKKYVGYFSLTIFMAFFVSILFSLLFIETTNYVFDNSEGTEYTYTVIKKHTSHSMKNGTSYWLTINKNDGEEISVKSHVYNEYAVNDRITLVRHVGALGIEYYEYIEN